MQFLPTVSAIIVVALIFAALSVSQECRLAVVANCRRLNGTWSRKRIRRECAAIRDYVCNLAVPFALSIPVGFLASQYVLGNLMPASQIVTAFTEFSTNRTEWKDRLQHLRREHQNWLETKDIATGVEVHNLQRMLWYGWPLFVEMTVAVGMICCWSMFGMSRSAVSRYVSGVRSRRTGYSHLDVRRMMAQSSMGAEIEMQR